MSAPDVLVLDRVSVTVGPEGGAVRPVREVSLRIPEGGTHVLLGESGCGKSMTLRTVLGLHPAGLSVGGRVVVDGQDVGSLSPTDLRVLRSRTLGFVPQNPRHAFDPTRRIGSQVTEVIRLAEGKRPRAAERARCTELLEVVGIPDPDRIMRSYPHELSGGLAQRAAIAMALVGEPRLIVADEPTTALDMSVQQQILALFAQLREERGTALLLVTHDIGVAHELGGDVSVMYAGRVIEHGATRGVVTAPRHPYTRALLEAQPSPGVARGALASIPGSAPAPDDRQPGCSFAPRCALAVDSCSVHEPTLVEIAPSRWAACPVVNDAELAQEVGA